MGDCVGEDFVVADWASVDRSLVPVPPIVVSVKIASNVAAGFWFYEVDDVGSKPSTAGGVDVVKVPSFFVESDCGFEGVAMDYCFSWVAIKILADVSGEFGEFLCGGE